MNKKQITVSVIRGEPTDIPNTPCLLAYRPFQDLGSDTEYFVPALNGKILWSVFPCSKCGKWYASPHSCPYDYLAEKWMLRQLTEPTTHLVWAATQDEALAGARASGTGSGVS